jgi:hypothetical protein
MLDIFCVKWIIEVRIMYEFETRNNRSLMYYFFDKARANDIKKVACN